MNGAYKVGGGVKAPKATYTPDPEYSEAAKKALIQGTVLLSMVISAEGEPAEIEIVRAIGAGLDDKAAEAVKRWKFSPAKRNGEPVPVRVNVEVNFHLY